MLNDKWALMMGIGYTSTINNNGGDNSKTSTANPRFLINPGVRRFLFSGQGGLFVDGEMEFAFTTFQTKTGNTVTSRSASNIFGGVRLGAAYFLTNHLMLISRFGQVGFNSYTNNTDEKHKTQTNKLSFIVNPADISIGLNYFF
jgi:hypothetical protein